MDEEETVNPKSDTWNPRVLDDLSIEALQEYIFELQKELLRVKKEVKNRHAVNTAAHAVFKK